MICGSDAREVCLVRLPRGERRHGGGEIGDPAAEFRQLCKGLLKDGIIVGHTPTLCLVAIARKFSVAADQRSGWSQPDESVIAFSMIPRWL